MEQNTKAINPILMLQYNAILNTVANKTQDNVKLKIQKLESAKTINEAKNLLKECFPEYAGKTLFTINGTEINICETDDFFRISVDSCNEFISYDFDKVVRN